MGKIGLKNIIMISVLFIFILSTVIIFLLFNNYYRVSTKNKFVSENMYSARIAKEMIEKEKNDMLLMARELAKSDVVYYAAKTGIYIAVDETTVGEGKEPKIVKTKMDKLKYITLLNLSGRTRDLNRQIFRYDHASKKFFLEASSRGQNFEGNSGEEKYLYDALGDGTSSSIEVTTTEEKDGKIFIKAICPIGLDTRWIPLILATAENIPGIVASTEQIEGAFLRNIKQVTNRDIVLIKDEKIIVSTIYDENVHINKNEKIDIKFNDDEEYFNTEIKINEKNMILTFFPIKNYEGKIIAYMGTGTPAEEVLAVFSKGIKSFIIYEIIFSLVLMFVLYFVIVNSFKPLGEIVKHIKSVGEGNYENKILINAQTELKILANSVNNLTEIVQKREGELKNINYTLEQKIEERTKKLQLSINRLKSIGKMISTVFTEQKEKNAIAYILALITSKAGLNYKKAIYFSLDEQKHNLIYRNSFYNMEMFGDNGRDDEERFGNSVEEGEVAQARLKIPMKEDDNIWKALYEKTVVYKKEKCIYFIEGSSKPIEFSNFFVVPVEYENKKYGVIVAEKFKSDKEPDDEETDILKILSMNLALFFENKRLEHEGIENEKLVALVQLSKGIVHELRTPITGIVGFAGIVKKNYPTEKMIQEYMEVIINESERIDNMAADLIEYAESEKSEIRPEKVSVYSIFSMALEKLKVEIESNGIKIINEVERSTYIYGDKMKLLKVFIYILKNSIEASRKKDPQIKISATDNNRKVIISIRDNGGGISEEKIEHVFEPLMTTKIQGTGMGLSIVKNIIEKHSAQIDIVSKENVGTDVSIVFDIKDRI